MSFSSLFIRRPVATTLLTLGATLAGVLAYFHLPVSPLPQVDYPTISITASLPGASPETVATSVATPLERHLGAIADVTEMTSQSTVGASRLTLQFGLDRDLDGAARDVQAAINAARADLPTALRSNPTYRKVNPSDAPIIILVLRSKTLSPGQLYDTATTILQQKLSQITGIGEVDVGGSSYPAVRVELQPNALSKYGIGLEDVRAALSAANANSPKGVVEQGDRLFQIYVNDQTTDAATYAKLVIAYRNGAPVRLSDVADVEQSVENLRNEGVADGENAVLVVLYREPGANIIETVDRVKSLLPSLQASIPNAIDLTLASDRTTTIRASLHDIERTLLISVGLVILVVYLFLGDFRATIIPGIAVPVSLIATFAIMYLLGYSLDNFSLMALTVSTGFVIDDAIVVLENVTRHIETGMSHMQAALRGAAEVGSTVLSMSLSLIAVFIPVLLMEGIVGRLFREFAVTLSISVMISLVVSLTTIPTMCAYLLKDRSRQEGGPEKQPGRLRRFGRGFAAAIVRGYESSLDWALGHGPLILIVLGVVLCLNFYLLTIIHKGFFPQQDTGRLTGRIQADQGISFQAMRGKLFQFMAIIQKDPAVGTVVGYTGGGQTNAGYIFVALKPLSDRHAGADQVIARLRDKFKNVPGASLYLQSNQDIHIGGRQGNAQYQYTLQSDTLDDLRAWTPKITAALQRLPQLADVSSDQQEGGLDIDLDIDRNTASRLGLTMSQIDNTLYDAFGQRQVATIYSQTNPSHVVMEVAPEYWQNPDVLKDIYISSSGGAISGSQATNALSGTVTAGALPSAATLANDLVRNQATNAIANGAHGGTSTGSAVSTTAASIIPLSAFSHFAQGRTPIAVNHQGQFAASTISFNLPPGMTLGEASTAIARAIDKLHIPPSIHGSFQGTASVFARSVADEPYLILAAIVAVYIVLGILYESYVHPITILSTLPSAGIGALLALMLFNTEFSAMALIGIILLIGISKKNAIMMIDVAVALERQENLTPRTAILRACLLRFRPIMMTTMVALLGALPLAFGFGDGAELRRPLGISIAGGLIVSQVLTLYTTPVVYLYLDRLRLRTQRIWTGLPLIRGYRRVMEGK